ncbi:MULTISPECIES: ArsR/SmtB family transcription factor [unclassified Meridianimarinicoccus]|uniref:ArsR/SmtB family transcription factor n=1 Tax=unclassified Meridianimarinicoccus TaxID=2923344 RepID=UPI0018681548|nr:helix-turn-helix domain-containing protein [Fluviibacterium sp. MJW13]
MEPISELDLIKAASAFAALGSEQRLAVLATLVRAGPEGLVIGELGQRCGVRGSTLTHHLKILAQAGLISQTKIGRATVCAAAAYDEVKNLSTFLLTNCCADAKAPHKDHDHDRSLNRA